MDRKQIVEKAVAFFSAHDYHILTQTDSLIVFQTEKREVNWIIVLVLCCLGIVPAVVYYYVFAPRHKAIVSMTGDKDASVIATGNTDMAKKDAAQFQQTIRG